MGYYKINEGHILSLTKIFLTDKLESVNVLTEYKFNLMLTRCNRCKIPFKVCSLWIHYNWQSDGIGSDKSYNPIIYYIDNKIPFIPPCVVRRRMKGSLFIKSLINKISHDNIQ